VSASPAAVARHRTLDRLWGTGPGWQALTAVNHSIVGRRFMVTAAAFFLIGGVLAMLIRAQLAVPHAGYLDSATYNQVFTMHGVVMMFLFAIPMIEGFALYMLPKLLGARDLAFPRLSAFGYWCYLFGGTILVVAMLVGLAPDSGWFMYTPLSSRPYSPGINSDVWLIGITFVEVSAVCAAVEFMATVLKVRADGMSLNRMPILAWYLWVTAAMMLFGFPPLILGSILLEIERAFGWPFFDPERGGDPLLWQHLFWLFGHPEVYIIFLPGAGIVSTVLPVFSGRPLVGYTWIVCALVALGFLSFGLWVHHMFTTGIPHLSVAFFSAASLLVVIPTAIQIFSWLATLLSGRPRLSLPMLYVLGFLFVFVAGGLTGVMVAVVPFDWQAHDTHFVVAHLHYVLVGGFVFPLLAGLYYWLPHLSGRQHLPRLGLAGFWLIFLGFNITFLPMHLTGLLGMPRRVFTYPADMGWDALNLVSSMGGFALAIGFALVLMDVVSAVLFGARAPRNPWRAGTLEWAMPTPPPSYNFASLPRVHGRDPLLAAPDLPGRLAAGEGDLAEPRHGWLETLGVHAVNGRPDQVILLPGPTWIPLLTAGAAAVFFLSFLLKLYLVSLVGIAGIVAGVWVWLWQGGLRSDPDPVPIGAGRQALPHPAVTAPPTLWGMVFTLMANGTLFGALAFGYLYLWAVAPNWPPPALVERGLVSPLLTLGALAVGLAAAVRAMQVNARGQGGQRDVWLLVSLAGGAAGMVGFAAQVLLLAPAPGGHAYAATVWVLCLYAAAHAGLGALIAAYGFFRARAGWVSAVRAVELRALVLWQGYVALTGIVVLLLVHAPVRGAFG